MDLFRKRTDKTGTGEVPFTRQSLSDPFLVKKLLNVGSTCNQSVSQSKLQRVNPTVIQSVSQSFNQSFIQLKEGSQLPTSCLSEDARMSRQQQNRAAQDNNVEIM